MIRSFRAEMVKLGRPRLLLATAVAATMFALVAAAVFILLGATPEEAARAGGGTLGFARATSVAGALVLAIFIGAVGNEFSRGTFRSMPMQQPGRLRLLAGKMAALLAFAAGTLAVAEALSWTASLAIAPIQDIDTNAWVSTAALGEAVSVFGGMMVWVAGWGLFGMGLGVLVRSVPIALGIGVAWAGPFEGLLADDWGPAARWLPGRLLATFTLDDPTVSTTRVLLTLGAHCVVGLTVTGIVLARRDFTS